MRRGRRKVRSSTELTTDLSTSSFISISTSYSSPRSHYRVALALSLSSFLISQMGDSTTAQQTIRKIRLGKQSARLYNWRGTTRPRQIPINQPRLDINVFILATELRYLIREISNSRAKLGFITMQLRKPENIKATRRLV